MDGPRLYIPMKRPSAASQRKVTAETLAGLGAQRLAEILADVAETRVDLKRRLRIELAAQQGPGPLTAEIDKRLTAFETSRGKITWRQRPAVLRDVDALRDLITARLAPLDAAAAIDRLWRFMDTAGPFARRYRERLGELEEVFTRAAADLGRLLRAAPPGPAAAALVDSLGRNVAGWKTWLPALLAETTEQLAREALRFMAERSTASPGWVTLVRYVADAAGDLEALRATYADEAVRTPSVAAELALRYLANDRVEDAGEILRGAAPRVGERGGAASVDFDWETRWIDYLARSGRNTEAQAVRWESFERTLSPDRARAYISQLDDFDDVVAETRAFEVAAAAPDFQRGLRLLMEWPALAEASGMIERRRDEVDVEPDLAELWAGRLRRRFPVAAHALLRGAAASAFRRRDFKTCDRLSAEAETISL
jgi:hypothetical protein